MLRLLVAMELLFIGLLPGYRKRYLVTGIPYMWEVSMGGSHNLKLPLLHSYTFCHISKCLQDK
jgi:hypothetical protein